MTCRRELLPKSLSQKITNFILSADVTMNCIGAYSFTGGGLINNVSLKHVYSSGQDTTDTDRKENRMILETEVWI